MVHALSMKRFFLVLGIFISFALPAVSQAKVYVIPLREDVDRYLGVFLGRSLDAAKQVGAELLIFEIDTFGGRVDTALEIAGQIGAATWAKTVAYIPSDSSGRGVSWSAGALIAFSCSELWMAPGTSMGAAAPVYKTAEGMQSAEEKTVSAVRGQMAALAEKNGYPVNVALAMVDEDVVLTELVVDGEVSLVTSEEIEAMKHQGIDINPGKMVSSAGKLLTLTAGEMAHYGVSRGSVSTRDELILSYGYQLEDVFVGEKSRSDFIITFLSSSAMTSLFLIVGLVALYLEITSPGFGLPGTAALICFATVFGIGALMGNLGSLEILMFLSGLVLLILEVFIIPGFGVAGIAGIGLIVISLVFSLQDFYWPKFDWQWSITRRNLGVVGVGILGSIFMVGIIMMFLPRASLFERLILRGPDSPGYGGKPRRKHQGAEIPDEDTGRVRNDTMIQPGMRGFAITDLHPVGKIRVENHVIVAETAGEYCEKGSHIVVLKADGIKVVVTAEEE